MRDTNKVLIFTRYDERAKIKDKLLELGYKCSSTLAYEYENNLIINIKDKSYKFVRTTELPNMNEVCYSTFQMFLRRLELNSEVDKPINSDPVHQPNHYNHYSLETIQAIKAQCTPDEFRGVLKGNVLKYIGRYRFKNGIQDLEKAKQYLTWLIEFEEEQNNANSKG